MTGERVTDGMKDGGTSGPATLPSFAFIRIIFKAVAIGRLVFRQRIETAFYEIIDDKICTVYTQSFRRFVANTVD